MSKRQFFGFFEFPIYQHEEKQRIISFWIQMFSSTKTSSIEKHKFDIRIEKSF